MNSHITLILTISFIIISAPFIAKRIKISLTPVEIMLGTIAAYYGYIEDNAYFKLLADFGFYYLMFLAGIEVELKLLLKMGKNIFRKAIMYILSLYLISALYVYSFDLNKVLIILLPLISVGLILTLQKEYGKTNWLVISMNIGILGEIVSIIVLTFTEAAFNFGMGPEFYKTILYLFSFSFVLFLLYKSLKILFWWYPALKTYIMPHVDNDEKDIRISMAIFFIMIALMLYLHLEIAFGVFMAGIFISTFFEHKRELPEKLSSVGFGFLIPIFFLYIGSTLNLNSITLENGDVIHTVDIILQALIITFVMVTTRVISAIVVLNRDMNIKCSSLFAISHSMPLTLLIAVATIALKTDNITVVLYNTIVMASIFEVIVSMGMIKIINKLGDKNEISHNN